jgi:FlaA1/EpsC-like NDP-sugar epimerase
MKKINQLFSFLLLPVDALMVFGAFLIAYTARAGAIAFPVIYIWPFDQYLRFAIQMLPIWLIAFAFAGLYKSNKKYIFEFGQIINAASLGAMAVVLWVFVFRSDFFSRLIVFYIWALSIIFVSIGRAILGLIRSNLHLFGYRGTGLVLVGNEIDTIETMTDQVKKDKSLGYRLLGIITDKDVKEKDFKSLGEFKDFEEIIKHHKPEEVILADPNIKNEDLFHAMRCCQELDIQFKAVPAHAAVSASTLQYDAFAGIPIIEFKGTPLDSWGIVIKRIFDFLFSIIALVILSPLMLIISILIKAGSKGPVIYKNIRVGQHGEFITYKFRTMLTDYCTGPS